MGNGKLPNGAARVRALVRMSAPRAKRPRLPEEYESQLQEIDGEMAATYASMEDVTDRLDRCIEKLEEDNGAVVGYIDNDTSLAVHVEDLADEAGDARSERLPVIRAVGEKD